jgi:hypothetical protein
MKRTSLFLASAMAFLLLTVLAYAQTGPRQIPASNTARQGRYQIVFGPFARADVYLLDTETGSIWRPVTYTDVEGDPEVWMTVPRLDDQTAFVRWMSAQVIKKKAQ